jgi:transposase
LLAHVLFAEYRLYMALNRQNEAHAREGVDLDGRPTSSDGITEPGFTSLVHRAMDRNRRLKAA